MFYQHYDGFKKSVLKYLYSHIGEFSHVLDICLPENIIEKYHMYKHIA